MTPEHNINNEQYRVPPQQDKEVESWEIEFEKFMNNHDNFMGGLSSNLIPNLKEFIRSLLATREREISSAVTKREDEIVKMLQEAKNKIPLDYFDDIENSAVRMQLNKIITTIKSQGNMIK